jgi:hypothetical protein
MTAWRYKYRKVGEAEWQTMSYGFASHFVAEAVVTNWNHRDQLIREWTYEECLPDDADYPEEVAQCSR